MNILTLIKNSLVREYPVFNTGAVIYGWTLVILGGITIPLCVVDPNQIYGCLIGFIIGFTIKLLTTCFK